MTRLVLVGILFANALATPSHSGLTARTAAVTASTSSENCFAQYLECSFRTDRPAAEPDCYEQFVACLIQAG